MTLQDLEWPRNPEGSREALFRELQSARPARAVGFLRAVMVKVADTWSPFVIRIDIARPGDVTIPSPWTCGPVRTTGERIELAELQRRLRAAFGGGTFALRGQHLANHGMVGAWEGRRRFSADPSYGGWPCVEAQSGDTLGSFAQPPGPFLVPGVGPFPDFVDVTRRFTGFAASGDARANRATIVIWDHRGRLGGAPSWERGRLRIALEGDALGASRVYGRLHVPSEPSTDFDQPSAPLVEVAAPTYPRAVDVYLSLGEDVLDQVVGLIPSRTPTKEPNMTAKKTGRRLTEDVDTLLRSLYRWQRTRDEADEQEGELSSATAAETLGWKPRRLNSAVTALERRGLIAVNPSQGSGEFVTHGFELAEEGLLYCERLGLDDHPAEGEDGEMSMEAEPKPEPKKVFVIHGRNLEARKQMGYFLQALGLEAVNFDDVRASLGGTPTVADIVTAGMDQAQGVIALFTADEHAWTRPDLRWGESGEPVERWQARPNVLFEAGMAFGRDRRRVVLVKLGRVSLFTDVAGIHALSPTNDPKGHRDVLRKTLKGMGCPADLESSKWLHDGDFETCVAGLPEVSARDPFRP